MNLAGAQLLRSCVGWSCERDKCLINNCSHEELPQGKSAPEEEEEEDEKKGNVVKLSFEFGLLEFDFHLAVDRSERDVIEE